ncbi:hypothetical protein LTT66_31055 [Nocardia gipuzkoensis]|nr:hypothetical protein [Nocardia gipuzkoensis]UGT67601.1 hypothetical protein LTT66_31055 [Nocardia gipuzkoensis]
MSSRNADIATPISPVLNAATLSARSHWWVAALAALEAGGVTGVIWKPKR